jgi:hypothetical protein
MQTPLTVPNVSASSVKGTQEIRAERVSGGVVAALDLLGRAYLSPGAGILRSGSGFPTICLSCWVVVTDATHAQENPCITGTKIPSFYRLVYVRIMSSLMTHGTCPSSHCARRYSSCMPAKRPIPMLVHMSTICRRRSFRPEHRMGATDRTARALRCPTFGLFYLNLARRNTMRTCYTQYIAFAAPASLHTSGQQG